MEIVNKQDHSLFPNDFFVIVNDPEDLYRRMERVPDMPDNDSFLLEWEYSKHYYDKGSLVNNADLKVTRVDGNIVSCYYKYQMHRYSDFVYIDIDMSKVDYKRIVCNW